MGDLTKLNEFMKQFLPLLLRGQMDEKRVQLYLDKALKEIEAYGKVRGAESEKEFGRKIMLQLIESLQTGAEGLDRPTEALLMRAGELGIEHPSLPTVTREGYGQAIAPFQETGATMTGLLEESQYPSEAEISNAIRVYGSKPVNEWLKELEKKRTGEAKLKETKESRLLQKERLTHDQAVLAQRKEEFALKGVGKGKVNEEDLKLYSLLAKKEADLETELRGLKEDWEDEIDEVKKKAIEGKLDRVREQKLDLVDKMLKTRLSTERINEIIQRLKSGNATVAGIEKNKERFMADLGLTDVEYDYIIFRIEK